MANRFHVIRQIDQAVVLAYQALGKVIKLNKETLSALRAKQSAKYKKKEDYRRPPPKFLEMVNALKHSPFRRCRLWVKQFIIGLRGLCECGRLPREMAWQKAFIAR